MSRQILIFFLKAKTFLQMSLSTLLFHRNNSLETRRKRLLNFMPTCRVLLVCMISKRLTITFNFNLNITILQVWPIRDATKVESGI